MSPEWSTPAVGVSACLLGESVRYDGGHKRNGFVTEDLQTFFDYVPVCPETAIGMSVPRPPIHLVGEITRPRAVGIKDPSMDVTDLLETFSQKKAASFSRLNGCILKKDSPSCGVHRVKIYPGQDRQPVRKGQGIFARILMERNPLLPVEDEGRLNDAVLRENFINRVYVHQEWQQLNENGITPAALIKFHSRHKYLVMGHSQAAYQRMGRMLSNLSGNRVNDIAPKYIHELMMALQRSVSKKRHVNVLQHIMGYLKKQIDSGDKAELVDAIEAYRRGEVPLIVPITLIKHYFRRHADPYILSQSYLQPHPEQLGLRNSL